VADVDKNASIKETVAYLARVRRIRSTWTAGNTLAHQVGIALQNASIPKSELENTREALVIRAKDLRGVVLDEVEWYARVATIQLHQASQSAIRGNPTLAKTSAYYASFYFANALCRIAGRIPLYLRGYAVGTRPGPTVMVAWNGITPAHDYFITAYRVRGGAPYGSHRAVWEAFFQVWKTSPDALPDYANAVIPQGAAGDESNERNDYTYRPWFGFKEAESPLALEAAFLVGGVRDATARNLLGDDMTSALAQLATDPDYGPLARACLRGLLLDRFLRALSERSKAAAAVHRQVRADLLAQAARLGGTGAFSDALGGALAS